MLQKKRILSIDVSSGTYKDFISAIINLAKAKTSSYICVANVHMLIEAHNSSSFARVVNNADIVTPDGMPLAKCFSFIYNQNQVRVDGMSLLPSLLSECQGKGLSVYFFGGAQSTLNETEKYLKNKYPDLKIAGMHSPPFRVLTEKEKEESVQMINSSNANLVFVVLGCPKQEIWMSEMRGKVSSAMIGVGGALPVLIGLQKRAPNWMQKSSLEWLYRLLQEPKRLFKRYFTTNSKFIYLLTKEKLKRK
ncbi:WecB/TagA/CpsF family glycosyltransferase [Pedobacter psychrodurus]|uniref:WecB/TagA/CpsF family glycosyltransferase n=1 Tax=Pedobacter psychrodurus TaxID=2530456 RepID=UPI00292D82A2|nr:WecB/TagA/CpsF family glycosyltransferase [Pedobacter psychrodurus]